MNNKILRFLAFGLGVLLLFHGVDKILNGTDFIEKLLVGLNVPYAKYVTYGVFVGEVVAPLFLIFGQYIRMSAAIIAVNMLAVIFLAHREHIIALGEHGAWSIEVPMLYLVMATTLALWQEKITFIKKPK